ncbi:MAG: hypothetical protein WAW79_00185 [Steroidobacteraceae bacterium]
MDENLLENPLSQWLYVAGATFGLLAIAALEETPGRSPAARSPD